jgi:hypothetical protein
MYHPYGIIHVMVVIKNLNFFLVLIEETEQYVCYLCTVRVYVCTNTMYYLVPSVRRVPNLRYT